MKLDKIINDLESLVEDLRSLQKDSAAFQELKDVYIKGQMKKHGICELPRRDHVVEIFTNLLHEANDKDKVKDV